MSFSSECKNELCLIKPEKSCCLISELCALYMTMGSLSLLGRGKVNVQFSGENITVCRRIYTLLTQALHLAPQIHYVSNARFGGTRKCVLTLGPLQSPSFLIALRMMTDEKDGAVMLRSTTPKVSLTRSCCMRAFLRGAMLGGGSITKPEQGYHLEISCRDDSIREDLAKCLQKFDLPIKQSARKGHGYLYLKQIDHIVTFLKVVGANQTVMEIENLRVQRQVLGSVHRMINCDNANLRKQMNASDEQLRMIAELAENDGLKGLPKSLQEMAAARLNAPDASLAQLGEAMNPPIGKSGVNHRMRRLLEYAENKKKETL
ncbi:MAG: DNA-binding protein WhiA [Eubacteriales bacterium]|nr:DNA-binding protein WhiA [Eubacteriales bacterium]